jgi:hypothetical protein
LHAHFVSSSVAIATSPSSSDLQPHLPHLPHLAQLFVVSCSSHVSDVIDLHPQHLEHLEHLEHVLQLEHELQLLTSACSSAAASTDFLIISAARSFPLFSPSACMKPVSVLRNATHNSTCLFMTTPYI